MGLSLKQTKRVLFLIGLLGLVYEARALEVGDKAPDFALPSTSGGTISLNDFRGRNPVLLEFYVRDFGAT